MQFSAVQCWTLLPVTVGGPSPILANGPGGSSPAFLAGTCCCCCSVVGGPLLRLAKGPVCCFPAFVAGVCYWWCRMVLRKSWLSVLGAVPHPSWLESAALVGGLGLANPGSGPCVRFSVIRGCGLLLVVVGCPSLILAAGPRLGSPPFLARVCCL